MVLERAHQFKRIAPGCLDWVMSLNTAALSTLLLDRTQVSALVVRELIGGSKCPQLQHLSIRFCTNVHAGQLIDRFDGLTARKVSVSLKRLDVVGINGLAFFEPTHNGITTFDAVNIELIGTGPEYDYTDRWREAVYDFNQTLSRVRTTHGACVKTDVARCSQAFCRNFDLGRRELANPTLVDDPPLCFVCNTRKPVLLCRPCYSARSCNICGTYICPDCHSVDNDDALYRLGFTRQLWLAHVTEFMPDESDCSVQNSQLSAKARLLMFQVHKRSQAKISAQITLAQGFGLGDR
ncbi:hypothetical protein BCR37DRAFT_394063 [Protomyces lactucae-debilis]|uniref:Uncharacterized protein n=1 Tax=Protomyces lactucae-debilis TaxID=2754530 RepID=A0A1Y2FAX1_PROLT|nr:uncharacterized protein BCR37DRAFT_394063 [Protomyces lactucae-debilis]ORY80005.1 hypothetical protein BCR37DRAFT_394063 [Protomyces lactucae-debilis]